MRFYNPNAGLHWQDPAYDPTFDEEEAYEEYLSACDDKYDEMRDRD